jgi:tetratricopeptide (TPR) repeat protein
MRRDVFRNANATHLLGNYPAAYNRAGYQFYINANNSAREDSIYYRKQLDKAIAAFEASLAVAPFNEQAIEFYPLLLVQAYRDHEAKDFLSSLAGNIPEELEERVVFNAMRGIARGGVPDLALDWIAEQIQRDPDRHFYRQVQFSLLQALGRRDDAARTLRDWEAHSGQPDPEMKQALDQMQKQALDREEQRIRDALEGGNGN